MVDSGDIDDGHESNQNKAAMHARKAYDARQELPMRMGLFITLMLPLAALLGCVSTTAPSRVPLASPAAPEVMMIVMEGKKNFTVFVEPNSIERERAIALATAKASGYCRKAYGSAKISFTKLKRRSWGVPDAWQIDGICT